MLLLTSAAFDLPHEPLPRAVYTGPVLDDLSWTEDDSALLADLDAADRPVVLATRGSTFQDQSAAYARVIEALGGLDVFAVVTLGDMFDPGDFSPAASRGRCLVEEDPPSAGRGSFDAGIRRVGKAPRRAIRRDADSNVAITELENAAARGQ